MGNPMKIRATVSGEVADIKVLMRHDMETGQRKNSTGLLVPVGYIQDVSISVNGKLAMAAEWGPSVSKDPYLAMKVKGAKQGDTVSVTWTDSKGDTRTDEVKIA